MLMISADVLALSSEAAVLVRSGRIQFANSAAKAILGEGCVGSAVKSVFGVEIAEAQAASFGRRPADRRGALHHPRDLNGGSARSVPHKE